MQSDKILNSWSGQKYIDEYEKKIKENDIIKNIKEIKKLEDAEEPTLKVTTKEGYEYLVTEDKVEYVGETGKGEDEGEDEKLPPPDLKESDIDFIAKPSEWTNKDVQLEITSKIEGYTLQYSTDGTNWNNYTEAITIKNNGAIYARLWNGVKAGGHATGNITNIDRLLPTVEIGTNGGTYVISSGNTTANITTKLIATDTGGSDLQTLQYQFSTATTVPSDSDSNWKTFTNEGNITENLSGGTYYLYTKVTDKAGNRATNIQKSNAYTVNYQVTYNANGGIGEPETQIKTHGSNLTLSATTPTRDGYKFAGWSTSSEGTVQYQANGTYSANESVTLYAKWTPVGGEIVTGNNKTHTKNGTAIIPVGFAIVPGLDDVSEGLVISDVANDTENKGNQFVWIPVTSSTQYKRNTTYKNTTLSTTAYDDTGYLPDGITNEEQAVRSAGGFYIARYEAGKEGTDTLVSKKGATVWNKISLENAKSTAKTMFTSNTHVKSALISGIQWDMTMAFIASKPRVDGTNKTYNVTVGDKNRHKGSDAGVEKSGNNEADKVCNIYDLEGNALEAVAEKNNCTNTPLHPYIVRGSLYSDTYPTRSASHRLQWGDFGDEQATFRPILYVR